MNVFTAIGRVGKDAVVRHTQGGDPVAGWSLAVDAGYGDKKVTTWLDCSLWGKRAETLAPMILKGDRLGVSGELSTREHEGKTYVTLRVSEVTLLAGKRDEAPKPERSGKPAPAGDTPPPDDDIPF